MSIDTQKTETPIEFVLAVEKYFGIYFDYDMAGDELNKKAHVVFDERMNSLNLDWPNNGWCWLNPPFANVGDWCKKCDEQVNKSKSRIISIWPLSSDKNMLPAWKHANVYIIHGRIWSLVRGLMLCVWGDKFKEPVRGLMWDKKTLIRIW